MLTPERCASSRKLTPSSSCAMNTSRCSGGSSASAASISASRIARITAASGPLSAAGSSSARPAPVVSSSARDDACEPRPGLLHRLHHPVGEDQLVKRLLQDVLGFRRIRYPAPDVGEQAPALTAHRGREVAVLLREVQGLAERCLHLTAKTPGRGKYCERRGAKGTRRQPA